MSRLWVEEIARGGAAGFTTGGRHLVGKGPLTLIYIHPCHDFANLKFCVEPLTSEVEELPIRPDLARKDLKIRVVGNNTRGVMSFPPIRYQ